MSALEHSGVDCLTNAEKHENVSLTGHVFAPVSNDGFCGCLGGGGVEAISSTYCNYIEFKFPKISNSDIEAIGTWDDRHKW
jgi:hypothetical protein